jgi:hypothetical protein
VHRLGKPRAARLDLAGEVRLLTEVGLIAPLHGLSLAIGVRPDWNILCPGAGPSSTAGQPLPHLPNTGSQAVNCLCPMRVALGQLDVPGVQPGGVRAVQEGGRFQALPAGRTHPHHGSVVPEDLELPGRLLLAQGHPPAKAGSPSQVPIGQPEDRPLLGIPRKCLLGVLLGSLIGTGAPAQLLLAAEE